MDVAPGLSAMEEWCWLLVIGGAVHSFDSCLYCSLSLLLAGYVRCGEKRQILSAFGSSNDTSAS
ncbi:hypothetical protein U9M48_042417, partial [Paspalum notatum var. saurae]